MSARSDHESRPHRRGCVWHAVPSRRFMELVGCLVLGAAVDAPDDVASTAVAAAQRTLELIAGGMTPPMAYEQAVQELVPGWARRR